MIRQFTAYWAGWTPAAIRAQTGDWARACTELDDWWFMRGRGRGLSQQGVRLIETSATRKRDERYPLYYFRGAAGPAPRPWSAEALLEMEEHRPAPPIVMVRGAPAPVHEVPRFGRTILAIARLRQDRNLG